MFEFEKLCKEVESLDALSYSAIILEKSATVLPALTAISGSCEGAVETFASFLIASVYADGKLDEVEYLALLPALKLCFGEDFNYDNAKALFKAFKPEGKELKKLVNEMVDLLGLLSEELKADIVTLSLLICAIDGKITLKEKHYIKQLIR